VTLAPVTLTAGESLNITACGLCGDKAVWLVYEMRKPIAGAGYTYHVQGTARSIVGAGATNDYPYRGGPWNACDGFLSIIVGEGITSIGDGAFYHTEMSYSYTDVSLPGTLRSIGDDAFNGLAFGNAMTLPEGLVSLGNNAFSNSTLQRCTFRQACGRSDSGTVQTNCGTTPLEHSAGTCRRSRRVRIALCCAPGTVCCIRRI